MRKHQCYWRDFDYKSERKPIAKGHKIYIKRQRLNELAHGQLLTNARLAVDFRRWRSQIQILLTSEDAMTLCYQYRLR